MWQHAEIFPKKLRVLLATYQDLTISPDSNVEIGLKIERKYCSDIDSTKKYNWRLPTASKNKPKAGALRPFRMRKGGGLFLTPFPLREFEFTDIL